MSNFKKDRLTDVVFEYLEDEDTSALTFYNDLVDSVNEFGQYHKKKLENATLALKLINNGIPRGDGNAVPSKVECPYGF